MIRNVILLAGIFAVSACSVKFDAQYGIRFEAGKIEASPKPEGHEILEPTAPNHVSSFEVSNGELSTSSTSLPLDTYSAPLSVAVDAFTLPYENTLEQTLDDGLKPVESKVADAAAVAWPNKKPERNMTVAWVLWAIPAILLLFAGGGLLFNFGAHWYYLGNYRKGIARTVIWALTLAVFSIVVFFANALGMTLLASLIALVLLLPLAVVQIIGLVNDFFALQKIANKKARGRKQHIV